MYKERLFTIPYALYKTLSYDAITTDSKVLIILKLHKELCVGGSKAKTVLYEV